MSRNENCEIIVVANQKGGVGKTTTAINLATGLAAVDRKVLLIDFDPQGNASSGLGVPASERTRNSYSMLIDEFSLSGCVMKTAMPNLELVPATVDLSAADVELATQEDKEFILKDLINDSDLYYDYIVIDTPPSLGLLTINSLAAASSVLIPMQCEYYALEGLAHLLHTIELIQKHLNPGLEINGVLLAMYDRRNVLTRDVEKDVRDYLGDKVFETVIPRNVRLSEAPSHGKPAILYDFRCPGSQAYLHLAREIIRKEKVLEAA